MSPVGIVLVVILVGVAGVGVLALLPQRPMVYRGGASGSDGWLSSALTDRAFLTYALVALISCAGVVWLGGMMWRAGAAHRGRKREGQEGAIALEFTMVLPIGLMLALVMAQSSLLMVGNICVNYASYCAARAAIVAVPEDLDLTSGEPPNYVVLDDPQSSMKLRRIHTAAVWAVLPVSCGNLEIGEAEASELKSGLSAFLSQHDGETPGWVDNALGRKLQYARDYTVVTLLPPYKDRDYYQPNEDLKVRVTHTFYMSVPYASRLFAALSGDDGVALDIGPGEYGMKMHTRCRLVNEGIPDWIPPERF